MPDTPDREAPEPQHEDRQERDQDRAREPEQDRARDAAEAKDEEQGREQAQEEEQQRERERAAERFRELTRSPLREEQDADAPDDEAGMAAATRARRSARSSFDVNGDLHTFDRSVFHSAHIGDVHLRLDERRSVASVRSGPVPEDELRRMRRGYVEPDGYLRLRQALEVRRLLVLGAAPGTGRRCTALSLVDELTTTHHTASGPSSGGGGRSREEAERGRVHRVASESGLGALASSLREGEARGAGYVLDLSSDRGPLALPDELDLDEYAAALAQRDSYAVLVVTVGAAAAPLLAGRYGMLCPPVPTAALLDLRLRERLDGPRGPGSQPREGMAAAPEALVAQAEALARSAEVRAAVGLDELRPAEVELLAGLLAERVLGGLTQEELFDGCRSLASRQAQEWFAGVDRPSGKPAPDGGAPGRVTGGAPGSGIATTLHPAAFRIALAVLGGAAHSTVTAAASTLTWELSMESDPDRAPCRPLFADDPVSGLALSRAELTDGQIETMGIPLPAQLVSYRGAALPTAVLAEVWGRHHAARPPIVRWLRQLADDPRPQVWVRAALATGELCAQDFGHGYEELLRPLATATTLRRRLFAATSLDQAARHDSHRPAVRRLIRDWTRSGSAALRWTAAMALGYGRGADSPDAALDALARVGVLGSGEQLPVATFNVARLVAATDSGLAALRRIYAWTHDQRPDHQQLGLVTIVRLAITEVEEVWDDETAADLSGRLDWPLPLALAAARPKLVVPLADLMWTALNTPRARDAALDAVEGWLRTAFTDSGRPRTRDALAALLPALVPEDRDRRLLGGLIKRMIHDQDDPISPELATRLWRLTGAAPPGDPATGAASGGTSGGPSDQASGAGGRPRGTGPDPGTGTKPSEEQKHG